MNAPSFQLGSAEQVSKPVPLQQDEAKWVELLSTAWIDEDGKEVCIIEPEEGFRTDLIMLSTLGNSLVANLVLVVSQTVSETLGEDQADIHNSAVYVLALVQLPDGSVAVPIVIQYRPPVNALVVEFPAGLVEQGESESACALRELFEETGLGRQGKVDIIEISGGICSDAGMLSYPPSSLSYS
jgi:ADP-ribose pyrophosphatase